VYLHAVLCYLLKELACLCVIVVAKLTTCAQLVSVLQSSKPAKKHKLSYRQKREIRDLVDLGDGYDESDTFIDNTEAVCILLFCLY